MYLFNSPYVQEDWAGTFTYLGGGTSSKTGPGGQILLDGRYMVKEVRVPDMDNNLGYHVTRVLE